MLLCDMAGVRKLSLGLKLAFVPADARVPEPPAALEEPGVFAIATHIPRLASTDSMMMVARAAILL